MYSISCHTDSSLYVLYIYSYQEERKQANSCDEFSLWHRILLFSIFLIYRLIYKGCLLHATMSLQDSMCTSECSFRIRNRKKHVWPICVVMSQREVKKLNSNLIASSHSLHFNSATVVQKDKGRLCFSAVKKERNWCGRGPFHQ